MTTLPQRIVAIVVGLVGVAASAPVCRTLQAKDPGCVVIDEVAGQFLTLRVPSDRTGSVARCSSLEASLWFCS